MIKAKPTEIQERKQRALRTRCQKLPQKIQDSIEQVNYFATIDSTNTHAKKYAQTHPGTNMFVVASEQTAGRGRMDKVFYSPDGGLYMSLLLFPQDKMMQLEYLTICASLAVSDVLDQVYGVKTDIKWLNDLFLDGKKIVGILSESQIQGMRHNYIIVGIGVNIGRPEIPVGLENVMSSLATITGKHVDDIDLAVQIVERFFNYYEQVERQIPALMHSYRQKMFLIGKIIKLRHDEARYEVITVDEQAQLIVRDQNQLLHTLRAGVTSIETWSD